MIESNRIHSDKTWLRLFLVIGAIAVIHLAATMFSGSLPHAVTYVLNPGETKPLDPLYVENDVVSVSYLIRNYGLRFAIYPVFLFTFLVDRFGLVSRLRRLSWRVMTGGLLGVGAVGLLVSKPYLFVYSNIYSWQRAALVLTAQIRFEGSSAHVYLYAIATWVLLVALCYRFLERKLPRHAALWITFLMFMSVEEVWEYANYVWAVLPITYVDFVNPPTVDFFTLYVWRATPSFLLLFYAWRWRFIRPVQGSWMERLFLAAIGMSVLLIVFPQPPFSFWLSLVLRIVWAAAYVAFAYYLAPPVSTVKRLEGAKWLDWSAHVLFLLAASSFIAGMFVKNYAKPALGLVNVFPAYFSVGLLGLAATVLYLTDHKGNSCESSDAGAV